MVHAHFPETYNSRAAPVHLHNSTTDAAQCTHYSDYTGVRCAGHAVKSRVQYHKRGAVLCTR